MKVLAAALAVVVLTLPAVALTQTLGAVCKEAAEMVKKGRAAPIKTPAIVSVERFTEPGVYDDVMLIYGYPDNYAAAREIAEYASQKYKRDYRVKPVQP